MGYLGGGRNIGVASPPLAMTVWVCYHWEKGVVCARLFQHEIIIAKYL